MISVHNVPGAFSSNKGRDFRTVLEEITKTDIPMPSSGKWATAGVVRGGQFVPLGDSLTLNIGEYPREESVSTLSEVLQVVEKNFWFITLCALLIISAYTGLNIFLRIAIAANAVVILSEVVMDIRRFSNGRKKEKN